MNPPQGKGDKDSKTHFERFIKAFIARRFHSRWQHILIEKPSKASEELFRFEHQCNEKRCHLISHTDWLALLNNDFADVVGLFFDGLDSASYLSGKQIVDRFRKDVNDALWLIKPAARAFVFSHDGYGWHCYF